MFLKVKVVPNSSRNQIVGWLGDALKIKVCAQPEAGKANKVVIRLLAELLDLPLSDVVLRSGHSKPQKMIELRGTSEEVLREALPATD